jgi:hypothetical protein
MEGSKVFDITSKVTPNTMYADDSAKVFYNQYSGILKSIYSLTNKQTLVVAELLYQNYLLKDKILDDELRWEAVFSKATRKDMQRNLNMTENSSNFGNNITDLRKKDILRGIRIIPQLVVYPNPEGRFSLTFNFQLA